MIGFALLLVVLSAVTFYRVLVGPTVADRIAAADAIGIMVALMMALLAVHYEFYLFLDVVLVYAVLLFADVMVFSKYFERGELHW